MRTLHFSPKICSKCGKEFIPRNSRHTWCDICLTKQCAYCGKEFHVGKKTNYETATFCSRECAGKYRSAFLTGQAATNYKNGSRLKVVVSCSYCGKTILKEKQFVDRFKHCFCDRTCQAAYYREHCSDYQGEKSPKYSQVEVRCEWCGKSFKTYQCLKDEARFCSKRCRNDWQSDMMKGEAHFNWKGGKTAERQLDMASREYKAWRKAVFERDNYTCQMCGDNRGGNLRAHHIKPYRDYPELRHDVDNGITYCEKCHIKVHSIDELDIQSELPK